MLSRIITIDKLNAAYIHQGPNIYFKVKEIARKKIKGTIKNIKARTHTNTFTSTKALKNIDFCYLI